jgi:hypothetical protein
MTSSGTATFAPGQMTQTFPVLDDSLTEGNEALNLSLSAPASSAGTPNLGPNNGLPASLTIVDDDSTYAFSSAVYSVKENDASGKATITVTRGGVTTLPGSVNYATSDGTAHQPGDYTATSGTLSFAAGETSKTFDVPVVNDGASEGTETVNLALTQSGSTLASSVLTILDNDNPLAGVQLSNSAYEVGETGMSVDITISLSHPVDGDVTVNYATSDATGTATADADYTTKTGSVTFLGNTNAPGGAGQTSKTITIPILDDGEVEGDETFDFSLSLPGGPATAALGTPSTATVTIKDDDLAGDFEFSALRYDVAETGVQAVITVNRVGGSSGSASVDYWTSDGTATAPADYATSTGTLQFGPGEVSRTFSVPVTWDAVGEGDETVNLGLANPSAGSDLANNSASVIHIADDGASGPVRLSAAAYSVDEAAGMVTVTVTRSGGSLGGPVTVDYATADGTATAGSDYTAASGTLTFNRGEATKSFTVAIANDSAHEDGETFQITLSNVTGGASAGSPSGATVTIGDDDAAGAAPSQDSPNLQSSPPQPNPAGAQTPAVDRRAPKLTVSARKIQKALTAKVLALAAKCDENCAVTVAALVGKGRKAIAIGKAAVRTPPGTNAKIKIKLSKNALAALTKLLKGGKTSVTISVIARDVAGNQAKVRRTVTVRR